MKRTIIVAILALMTTLSIAQNTFQIGVPFNGIRLSGALKVELIPSDTVYAEITVHGLEQKRVQWKVKDGVLDVTLRVGLMDKDAYADVKIYYSTLDYIGIEGVTLASADPMQFSTLNFETLGGINKVKLDIDGENLYLTATGDSQINLSGSCGFAKIKAYMGANVDCLQCNIPTVTAIAKQRAEIYVKCETVLDATVSMGANIFYLGSPRLVAKATTGGGIISVDTPKENSL